MIQNEDVKNLKQKEIETVLRVRLTGTDSHGKAIVLGLNKTDAKEIFVDALLMCCEKLYVIEELIESGKIGIIFENQ